MKFQKKILTVFLLITIGFASNFIIWHVFAGIAPPQGWEFLSRNVNVYVNETSFPHLMPEKFCQEKKFLVVMISSNPDNFELRAAIRETWAQEKTNVSFYFLVGEVKSTQLQQDLNVESSRFDDIIQERFVDSYNNLTLKSIQMLKLFKMHCLSASYLLKVDDDVFLNVPLLLKSLFKRKKHKNVLLGRRRSRKSPFRNCFSKWYMPYEWYPESKYPDFLCGPGYLMSADVARQLYSCALNMPYIHLEDIFLTGVCANAMKIKLEDSEFFSCDSLMGDICRHKELYTLHYYTPIDIITSYYALKYNKCEEPGGFFNIKSWLPF